MPTTSTGMNSFQLANSSRGVAEDQPGPALAPGRSQPVAKLAHQRVDHRVEQARQQQHGANSGEIEAEPGRVEGRQVDIERQVQCGQRQRQTAIAEERAPAQGRLPLSRPRHRSGRPQYRLHDVDRAGAEARLAIGQVVGPDPAEALVEAELANARARHPGSARSTTPACGRSRRRSRLARRARGRRRAACRSSAVGEGSMPPGKM